ncbi:hypothetical protein ElyMa_000524700, partial [Elysia marginata]
GELKETYTSIETGSPTRWDLAILTPQEIFGFETKLSTFSHTCVLMNSEWRSAVKAKTMSLLIKVLNWRVRLTNTVFDWAVLQVLLTMVQTASVSRTM